MTLTVVIASYKYGHLAGHCIDTVISQTRPADDIIFVDDGVGDCKHLQKMYPEVDFILREKNLGTVANFNDILMNHIYTDRVMFIGADNWLRQDALELLDQKSADIVVSDVKIVGEMAESFSKKVPTTFKYRGGYYWERKGTYHGSMLYNVEKAKAYGYVGHERSTQTEEDKFLFNKMVDDGATVAYVEEPLLYYRRHRENHNPC